MDEDLMTRERNVAGATAERDRIRTEATGMAEKRTGLMASNAGLDDASYRGDEGVGVSVQKGQASPTARDMAFAKGDYSGVMSDERAERTAADTKAERATDNERADRQLSLQEKQEKRLAAVSSTDQKLKQIQLGQAQEVETLRKRAGDKSLTPAERAEAKEMYQVLSGKDADQWEIVKVKDQMGTEVVTGRQNKKTGAYQKFTGDGFADSAAPAAGGKAQWDNSTGDVIVGGKVVGNAKSQEEAMRIARGAAAPAKKTEAAPEKKPAAASKDADWSSELSRTIPEHRQALDNVKTVESRLAYLRSTGAVPETIRDVEDQLAQAKREIARLAFADR
jgi:hypothetical protein